MVLQGPPPHYTGELQRSQALSGGWMEVLRNTDKMVVLSACSRLMYTAECRARDLYRGMEHKYVRSSIDFLRERGVEVTWYIISANYGIVGESDVLHPYDFTFSDLRRYWVRSIAADRGIPYRYRKIIRDLDGAVLLHVIGESYMLALKIINFMPWMRIS